MIAFHGDDKIKAEYIARVRAHREADQLVQGYGYWQGGRGCAVGCTMHTDSEPHEAYETTLGIPARLAYLEDCIFESLPVDQSRLWPEKFLQAIPVGKDLSRVWHQFAAWLLLDSGLLTLTDDNRDAITRVAELHRRAASGEAVAEGEWSAAAWSSESAAAAWSAAAEAAAAWSAAAESAAWLAAWLAAWEKMAAKLLDLLAA